jgi:hypothetical protein
MKSMRYLKNKSTEGCFEHANDHAVHQTHVVDSIQLPDIKNIIFVAVKWYSYF